MKKYSIEEIRKYLEDQQSLGDALYNLNHENVEIANIDYTTRDAYKEGFQAGKEGKRPRANPYTQNSLEHRIWGIGWEAGWEEYKP